MKPGSDDILAAYQRQAALFDQRRARSLFERPVLARMMDAAPGPRVLDIGCGNGRPIARWLADQGARVTGVDGAEAMLRLFRGHVPGATAVQADMRRLRLGRRFDAIIAWNSFFHLCPNDQRAMFAIFRAHAAPGAALVLSTGPAASIAFGKVGPEPVYHSSLAPLQYRQLFRRFGFQVLEFRPEDPKIDRHSHWLARFIA